VFCLSPVECHMGWNHQGNAVTVVAIVKLNEQRQGVLAIAHFEKTIEASLRKGITTLLRKVVESSTGQSHFIWSIPAFSTLCIMMGQSFEKEIGSILSGINRVERQDGDSENKQIEEALDWSLPQLFEKDRWKTRKIVGTTLDDVEKHAKSLKEKDKLKIKWATLFQLPDSYVAFDLETTGKHAKFARIIEIAGVKVDKGKISTFHTYVNPQMKLPKSIRLLTNVTQKQVDTAPPPWQAIRSFFQFIGDVPLLIGHNVQYDLSVLHHACIRFKMTPWKGEAFCTKQFSNSMIVGIPNTKLETVCESLGIINPAPHQALADADCSRMVFEKLLGSEQHLKIPESEYRKICRT